MKKTHLIVILCSALIMLSACEHSDCECKYYDENERLVAAESWDGDDVSSCQILENDTSVEIGDETISVNSVSCEQSW